VTAEEMAPQNIEAEESVLGAMFVAGSAVSSVIEVGLNAGDFYLDMHGALFACALGLSEASKPVDELSIKDALTAVQREPFERAEKDPALYVAELTAKVGAPGNAKHYAEIIQRDAHSRRVIEVAQQAIGAARGGSLNGEATLLAEALTISGQVGQIATVRGSDVRLRAPRFLDGAEMIPRRSITVAFGPAGLGKTIYGLLQCAAVTTGRMSGLEGTPAPVLISSQEDDPEAVLAPRLVADGADLELVHFVSGLSLPSQVPALAARARALGVALVLIDPIGAHLDPQIDSHRDAATRAALAPLGEMATDLDLAVLVVCHPNKATSASGLNRISGSGAFGNAARSVVVFGLDPADPEGETGPGRIIAHLKCNVGKRAPSICAEIETTQVETEDGPTVVPRLRVTGLSAQSADDILASPTGEERSERDSARAFLTEQLTDGPIRSKELRAAAEASGEFNWRTAERAKRDLNIKAVQRADGWYWELSK
jgi:putative DNA primase/helicase